MKRIFVAFMAMGLLVFSARLASAVVIIDYDTVGGTVNGLNNGNLDVPGVHEGDFATGWVLDEYRTVSGPTDTSTFASFANRTVAPKPPGSTDQVGFWGKSFSGSAADPANADLYQDNPGAPGFKYTFSGWARFEQFYAGGFVLAPALDPVTGQFVLSPSPTDTFFAIDFLDGGGNTLSSAQLELFADGQLNNQPYKQHTISAISPAGTVTVRARASMVNAIPTFGSQSVFFDDFRLEGVQIPEPASVALVAIGLVGLLGIRRRSK
jgi:hypothetical protein